ncbi:MAG: HK97 gp10 family phage protein [Clostridiales bacterium]|nr:HK97 gp10 family phage protein [Clostridiales bacterium]
MASGVSIDDMANAIMQGLEEYADLATEDMKEAVKKTASSVRSEIKQNAPVDTGAYKKSWATKKTAENSQSVTYTVYSKNRYQIAHLLENGHANRNGGRTKAIPHIAPAAENGEAQLKRLINAALKG